MSKAGRRIPLTIQCLLFNLISLGNAQAQFRPQQPAVSYPPQLVSGLTALRDAALTSDYAQREVAHVTEDIGPNLGGSPQDDLADQLVAEELLMLVLVVQVEEVGVGRCLRGIQTRDIVN